MKLYDVPRNSLVRVVGDNKNPPGSLETKEGSIYKFLNIDGMYSYCEDENNNVVHLAAWTDVEVVPQAK